MQAIDKQLNLLGLAQRASLLISGDEQVEKAVKRGRIKLLVLASDLSEASTDRYQRLADQYQLPLHQEFTKIQISHAIGKSRAICGLTDHGMSQKFLSYVTGDKMMND